MGLDGRSKAGSLSATTTCVSTVATGRSTWRARQLLAERLLEQVADLALRGRAADVQRERVDLVRAALRAEQRRAHLRTVAVGDEQPPAVGHQGRDRAARRAGVLLLFADRAVVAGANERIAADRDERGLPQHGRLLSPSGPPARPSARAAGSPPGRTRPIAASR